MESWGGGIGQGSVVNALPWGPKPWAPTLLKGRRVGEMGLSCLQPLHSPGQHRETQISTSCCFMEPQIPTLCWEKALGPPQHCARPPTHTLLGHPQRSERTVFASQRLYSQPGCPHPLFSPQDPHPRPPSAVCPDRSPSVSERGQGHHLAATHHHCTYPCARPGGSPGCNSDGGTRVGAWGAHPAAPPPLGSSHPPRAPMGAGPGRQHPALVPPALPCCSVRCRPAVTGDIPVCTTGFIEHGEAGGRGRVRTESCGQSTAPLGVRGGIFIPGHGVEA